MISNNFSLAKTWVINPTLHLQTEPSHFLSKEVLARILASTTSVFTAIDATAHLITGTLEGGYALLQRALPVPTLSASTTSAAAHFSNSLFFTKITFIASFAGIINPKSLIHFEKAPELIEASSPVINKLVNDILEKNDDQSIENVKAFWEKASLQDKHEFVLFFRCVIPKTDDLPRDPYELLKDTIYTSTEFNGPRTWESLEKALAENTNATYYHSTSKAALYSILSEGRIRVTHEKMYRGAFVSTYAPESCFGSYTLALTPEIERLSKPNHSFKARFSTQWTGFSQPIPINNKTLSHVIVETRRQDIIKHIEQDLSSLAGRHITVISEHDAQISIRGTQNKGLGFPKEWQNDKAQALVLRALTENTPANSQKAYTTLSEDLKEPFNVAAVSIAELFARMLLELQKILNPQPVEQTRQMAYA
jgi:hypothetical protein